MISEELTSSQIRHKQTSSDTARLAQSRLALAKNQVPASAASVTRKNPKKIQEKSPISAENVKRLRPQNTVKPAVSQPIISAASRITGMIGCFLGDSTLFVLGSASPSDLGLKFKKVQPGPKTVVT
jgi:hypothetical protein